MYGGDGTSARALANEEERRLEKVATRRKGRRSDEDRDEAMPSTEVVKNRRHNKCVPSSARLANAAKTGDTKETDKGPEMPKSTTTDFPPKGVSNVEDP